jgi:shikimate kinase
MGSGKSSVGPPLAAALRWDFRDLDDEVEERTGRAVPDIILESGEASFRRMEEEAARHLLALERLVISTGGGWPCRPGRMEGLPPGTLAVWLQVNPAAALERIRGSGTRRPLLEGPDPEGRALELLAARRPYYALAHWHLDSGTGSPLELARRIAEAIHSTPGTE